MKKYGYTELLSEEFGKMFPESFAPARIISRHKDRYSIVAEGYTGMAELSGKLMYSTDDQSELPAVGDYVAVTIFGDSAIIQDLLPRKSSLARKASGGRSDKQLIAANIDIAFVVMAADRDFNINRVERYITLIREGNIKPGIIVSKSDLTGEDSINEMKERLSARLNVEDIHFLSSLDGSGIDNFESSLAAGKTYCFVGSSGAGKSTLINRLAGKDIQETLELSDSTGKGRHTTTRREIILLPSGALIIDTPGMREVGISVGTDAVDNSFEMISELAPECRFDDCTHVNEPGCRVLLAVEQGELDPDVLENYHKLSREAAHYERTDLERRRRDKEFGKMVKDVKAIRKKNRMK